MKKENINILLVYPKYLKTFWSFEYVMKIIGKKAAYPPLGLLTISSMLPKEWNKRLIDTNVKNLEDADIEWADYIFISAMIVQKDSAFEIIERAKKAGKTVVAGGPLFTTDDTRSPLIDVLFLGEAEKIIKGFIQDVKNEKPKKTYQVLDFPDISESPIPDWQQINISNYHSMPIQYSRGCPFDCEFCDVVILNGRRQRTKTKIQIINELDALHRFGWRGAIFFVDDNFIGNKSKLKKEILPEIINWQKLNKYPFVFNTQVSINLSDDEELIRLMVDAGFIKVFIGIETTDPEGLEECGKYHNQNRDLVDSVKKLHNFGLEVQGGFIVGFDSDTPKIFQRQIDFIQKSGIVTAMVGLLTALPNTRLYRRLLDSKRIVKESSANNTFASTLNFVPAMGTSTLFEGYNNILNKIYNPRNYNERIKNFLREYKPPKKRGFRLRLRKFELRALFGSIWFLGMRNSNRKHFWFLLLWVAVKYPGLLPQAIGHSLEGIHLRSLAI